MGGLLWLLVLTLLCLHFEPHRTVPALARLVARLRRLYAQLSLKAQLKEASKSGAAYAVVLGADEVSAGTAVVRDMAAGEESTVAQGEIAGRILTGNTATA